jgi:hypothetical protein
MTTTTFKVLGIPMQRRNMRRRLVVLTYLGLLLICCGALWAVRTQLSVFAWAIYAAMAISIFIFGGQGRHGLIKSFVNKPPPPEPPILDLVRLHLQPESRFAEVTSAWKNDERELSRRDLAHYRAYQPLTIVLMVLLLLSAWALHPHRWMPEAILLQLIFAISLFSTVLALTLPAAIILWTEPDMDTL